LELKTGGRNELRITQTVLISAGDNMFL